MAGSCSFQNGRYKNAANDCNCLFPAVCYNIFCIFAVVWTFVSGLMSQADPANPITWKNLSPVSRTDPGIAIPRDRLTWLPDRHVIAKLIFVAFNKRAEIPAN